MEGLIAVLLFVLKLLGWLLLAVLAILLIALIIPVGAQFVFADRQFSVNAKVGPVQFRVFPLKKKAPKPNKQPAAEPDRQEAQPAALPAGPEPAPAKPAEAAEKRDTPAVSEPPPQKTPEPPKETKAKKEPRPKKEPKAKKEPKNKQKSGGAGDGGGGRSGGLAGLNWRKIASALQLLPWALKKIIGSFRLYDLHLVIPVHGKDAADTAITYGRLNAGLGVFLAVVQNLCRPDIRQLDIICDYTGEQAEREYFSCKLTTHLLFFVIIGVVLLVKLKVRKII